MNVLVLGKSKTGTTVISKTICHSLPGNPVYIFEPTDSTPFLTHSGATHSVTKILFDTWIPKMSELSKIVNNAYALRFDKRVVLRRDPRDELISLLLYYPFDLKNIIHDKRRFDVWIEFLQEKEQNPASISFVRMCEMFDSLFNVNLTNSMTSFSGFDSGYTHFCKRLGKDCYRLKYEDFMAGNTKALEGYLQHVLSENRDVGEQYKHTFRTGTYNNWKRYFTEQDIEFFKQYSEHFKMLGYDDWDLTPVNSISEKELSGYVRMLLAK